MKVRSVQDGNDIERRIRDAIRRDDGRALDMIWDRHSGEILAFLTARLCSRSDAEDVLQDVFVRIARAGRRLLRARSLRGYLFAMARNAATDFVRRVGRETPVDPADFGMVAAPAAGPEAGLRAEELGCALTRLPEEQREVMLLKAFRGMTFRDIGEALGIPLNTAASRYRYGLEGLRRLLVEDEHDG
jgi:RNA polymerase sigma-70 factor, ECF subfamily